jgi:hypothetical protein
MISTLDFDHPASTAKPGGLAQLLVLPALAAAVALFTSTPAWATGSVLSGMFDGTEQVIAPLAIDPHFASEACANAPSGYLQSKFAVSASGTYRFSDALGNLNYYGDTNAVNVNVALYEGSFDVAHPGQNLIASGGFQSASSEASLTAASDYVLVVQLSCSPAAEGAWAVTFTGPGSVRSDHAVSVPAFTLGAFTDSDPIIDSQELWDGWAGGVGRYQQSGPIQVSRDGAYYFSGSDNVDALCLLIYTAPISPLYLWSNLVTAEVGAGIIQLEAGQDYYFVVQQCYGGGDEYVYVLAPPAPFRINHGLADSWYNPETPGQGFFLDVFEQLNQVFLGWFTYAIDPPADDDFGHRWLTAFGPFAGTSAELAIEWTAGGAFDAAQPEPRHHVNGTIQLEFSDCESGQITYTWNGDGSGVAAASGVIPIQRNANDSVALCESLYAGPGMPGPL